ncbi:MAG: peptidase M23 [Lysobacterales bacterium RIFOXYD1_FULL_69_11]|nr:MAG: peptidase M23 [Xanthomonadales bacterium RIFOXYA1_FULL_69_10]OHE86669.1 MAG: peptidase M23 [Xanthomonadales bacterium RIFOXYD1_FULL_69_11]
MLACGRPVLALLLAVLVMPAAAQDARNAEQRLETVRRELKAVASERRKLEGERGSAARALREADEAVGTSTRRLGETRQRLADEQQALAGLQQRREQMQARLGTQREQLKSLLRAAYRERDDAPLKALLAQDRLADANRVLTYHRYLQRHRAERIAALAASLRELDAVERDIVARQAQLEATREQLESELASLEASRKERAETVDGLDRRYKDRSARERALGRDAKGLEQLLGRLRAAAARAEAARKAAAAARDAARATAAGTPAAPPAARPVPAAPAPQVGGLGWPVSGALLAGYGGKLPDGRGSDGLLIGASAGAPVRAVADGQVVYAEWMTGYGLLLIVDHGNGYMSLYAHNDALLKDPGDTVTRGEAVAAVGSSGGHGRPALYFELRRNGDPVDPTTWLRR